MKTAIRMAIVVTLALLLAAVPGTAAKRRLVIWNGGNVDSDPGTVAVTELFNKMNPDIEAVLEGIPYDSHLTKTIATYFGGSKHTPFDVNEQVDMWIMEQIPNGWLMRLDNIYLTRNARNMPKTLRDAIKGKDGHNYAVPHFVNALLFCYNKKLLREAGLSGPPKTLDELKEYAVKLTKNDVYGLAFPLRNADDTAYWFQYFLYAFGGSLYDSTGKLCFNNQAGVAATEYILDLYRSKVMPPGVTSMDCFDVNRLFLQGKVAMMINWTYLVHQAISKGDYSIDKNDIDLCVVPKGPSGVQVTAGSSWVYTVSKTAANLRDAVRYVEFWTRPEALKTFLLKEPARGVMQLSVYDDPDIIKLNPWASVVKETVRTTKLELGPKQAQVARIISNYLSGACATGKSAKETMDEAFKEVTAALSR